MKIRRDVFGDSGSLARDFLRIHLIFKAQGKNEEGVEAHAFAQMLEQNLTIGPMFAGSNIVTYNY